MKQQSKELVFDPSLLGSPATLLDIVAWYGRLLIAANIKPTLPIELEQPTLLDCAAAYHRQLSQL